MRRLLKISDGLESSHGNIVLKWKEHSWTVILDSCGFDECVISDEVQMLIRDIQKQLDSRFPNKDTDLLNHFRIFDITQMKYLKPSQLESYGVAELTEIMETLNQKDAPASFSVKSLSLIWPMRTRRTRCFKSGGR
jgi:hypothetical protein